MSMNEVLIKIVAVLNLSLKSSSLCQDHLPELQ